MKKRNIIKILLALVVLGLCQSPGVSQTKKAFIKAAEAAGAEHDHFSEMVYYNTVLEFDEDNVEYLYKTAEAARNVNALTKADSFYGRVIELDESSDYPLATFRRGQMLQGLGKYKEAQDNYQIFLSEYTGSDETIMARARKELSASEWAEDYVKTEWKEFQLEHLSGSINTPYSEFGATAVGDSLYFSSLRFENKTDKNNPTRPITGILVADGASGNGVKMGDDINIKETHTAHTAFNQDGSRMYFTICEYGLPDSIRCDLHYRDKVNGAWGEAVAISGINDPSFTSTQPNVGHNSETNESHLYFASDRQGTKGGFDLYRAPILSDGFGEIEHLDKISTAQDDVTPFYHPTTKTLYFSSGGYKTLGGLDVFKSSLRTGDFGRVQHLGSPLNSSFHDLYFSLNDKGDEAYFSSNRIGSFYLDEAVEACCYDIYKVDILPFVNLIAQTFDAGTLDSLDGTLIRLLNLTTGEEFESTGPDLASAEFPLTRDMEYMIIATKENYIPDSVRFNTVDIKSLDDIVKKLYLRTDILTLDAFTFDDRTKEMLRGATVTLYDLDDSDEDPIIITNFDDNDFHFELERSKRYRLTATRKGYKAATVVIDTNDYKDKSIIRQNLYLQIGDLSDFLPLVLYFDNDHPHPDTWLETSKVNYTQTYPDYFARKQTFIDLFTAPLTGNEKSEKANQLSSFFDTEVKKGNDDLLVFLEVLEAHLDDGDKVNIYLKGYTSPRSHRAYNFALGNRRVSSVERDFKQYDNGKLESYLDSNQLTIGQKSFGETTSPRGISSSIPNERLSIYSYEASKERRVEIIQIDITK